VPQMSGETDSRMAEAIEASSFVVVCVSSKYKDSANCRMEAKYTNSLAKKGMLNCVFVMMDSNYTTHSSPDCIDGWLAFMIGDALWYPLWEEAKVQGTANELSKIFGSSGKVAVENLELSSPTSSVLSPIFHGINSSPLKHLSCSKYASATPTIVLPTQNSQSRIHLTSSPLNRSSHSCNEPSTTPVAVSTNTFMQQGSSREDQYIAEINALRLENSRLKEHTLRLELEISSEKAWSILKDSVKVKEGRQEVLRELLGELGVTMPSDLYSCTDEQLSCISMELKPVQTVVFLSCFPSRL
jgi:hypothetical protein